MATKKKTATKSGMELLKEVSEAQAENKPKKPNKKGTGNHPTIILTGTAEETLAKYVETKRQLEDLELRKVALSDQLLGDVSAEFDARSKADQTWYKSMYVTDTTEANMVQVIRSTKRPEVASDQPEYKMLTDEDKKFGTEEVEISLKAEVAKSQSLLNELVKHVPPDVVNRFFNVRTIFKAHEDVQDQYYNDETVQERVDSLLTAKALAVSTFIKTL